MGKRELVLVIGFLVLGVVVYQLTVPPPPPGSEGFSFSGLRRSFLREVKGPRETASADASQTAAIPAGVGLLRLNIARPSDVTITGEERNDIAATLHVVGRGFDQAEATASAKGTRLKVEMMPDAAVVSLDLTGAPQVSRTQPPPTISLTLLVPKRLTVRAEPHIGRFVLTNVAGGEVMSSRGDTRISGIAHDLRLTHNFGALDVSDVAALKLTARNSRGTVKDVSGPLTLDGIGGALTLTGIAGPIEIEGRNTDIALEADARLRPPLRIVTTGGELRVRGLRTETRIDGRNTDIAVTLDAPAPVTIYNLGAIVVMAPPGGYALDAVATEARVTVEDGGITATEGPDSRAEGKVRGGGPALTLRATRGRIEVRAPAGK